MAYEEAYCNYDDYIPEDVYLHEDKSRYDFTEEEIGEAYEQLVKSGCFEKEMSNNQSFAQQNSANS